MISIELLTGEPRYFHTGVKFNIAGPLIVVQDAQGEFAGAVPLNNVLCINASKASKPAEVVVGVFGKAPELTPVDSVSTAQADGFSEHGGDPQGVL